MRKEKKERMSTDLTTLFMEVMRMNKTKEQMPYNVAMAAMVKFFNKIGVPFPEEMNRKLTGALADMHFSPTTASKSNLLREGVDEDTIFITGNTVIDAMEHTVEENYVFENDRLNEIDFDKKIQEGNVSFGIVMLDINYLKETNDTYGHNVGNKLICTQGPGRRCPGMLINNSKKKILPRLLHAAIYILTI